MMADYHLWNWLISQECLNLGLRGDANIPSVCCSVRCVKLHDGMSRGYWRLIVGINRSQNNGRRQIGLGSWAVLSQQSWADLENVPDLEINPQISRESTAYTSTQQMHSISQLYVSNEPSLLWFSSWECGAPQIPPGLLEGQTLIPRCDGIHQQSSAKASGESLILGIRHITKKTLGLASI